MAVEQGHLPAIEQPVVPANVPRRTIPGLDYAPDFLDEAQERRLIGWIDQQPWNSELKRRVQHYGWRYDYKAREVDASMRLGPLPAALAELAERLFEEQLVPQLPDQVIVNEYKAGQGIAPHIDVPGFSDVIATISLLESWEMNFHAPRGRATDGRKRVEVLLQRRSAAIMRDEARYHWKHEIRKRRSDPAINEGGERRPRRRRISLTFRKVRADGKRR